MMPHNNGMMGLAHFGFRLNDYHQHIIHTLKKAGYFSALAGVQHIDEAGASHIGYDALLTVADRQNGKGDTTVQRAVEFLKNPPQQPFFLAVGFNQTHRVYAEPEEINPNYVRPPAPIPDTPETRQDMAAYMTTAGILDEKMGRVLAALDETGLAENTLVVCTTDHGLPWPAMKCNLTDHGTGVMLMMRGPGPFSGGKTIDALVSQLDIYPTLCELAGVEPPEWLQGKSLVPLVNGQVDEIHTEVFNEVTFHVCYEPMRAIRTSRWKYIRRFEPRSRPVMPNTDDSLTKTLWIENGWANRSPAEEQLYDLIFDPNEANNLALDPNYDPVKIELAGRLTDWMLATQDPLLEGTIQWPAGVQGLDPDKTSPSELDHRKFI